MTTNTKTATPRKFSVEVTATCENCGEDLTRTIDPDSGEMYAWYHPLTGAEECQS